MRTLPQALCLIGSAMSLTGVAFKLNHLAGAHIITNAGLAILVLGLLLWASALLRSKESETGES